MFELIIKEVIHSAGCFVKRWYIERTMWFWSSVSDIIHSLDRKFAVFINIKLFFTPLYGDYSITGKLLGPIFRIWRILSGLVIYICLVVLAGIVWACYCMLLPYFIFRIIS